MSPTPAVLQHDDPTEVAYRFVADGVRRALAVPGLAAVEVEGLQKCLRGALEISGQPPIEREEEDR